MPSVSVSHFPFFFASIFKRVLDIGESKNTLFYILSLRLVLRGDRLDDQALGYHAMNPTYSNTYDVEYYQNDVDNTNGLYGRINAAQRANYVVQPTGTCTCCLLYTSPSPRD